MLNSMLYDLDAQPFNDSNTMVHDMISPVNPITTVYKAIVSTSKWTMPSTVSLD